MPLAALFTVSNADCVRELFVPEFSISSKLIPNISEYVSFILSIFACALSCISKVCAIDASACKIAETAIIILAIVLTISAKSFNICTIFNALPIADKQDKPILIHPQVLAVFISSLAFLIAKIASTSILSTCCLICSF